MSLLPEPRELFDLMHATWPAAEIFDLGHVTVRRGEDGGKRVSAATLSDQASDADISKAEAKMCDLGQNALFMLREGQGTVDQALAAKGYGVVDPVTIYAALLDKLPAPPPEPLSAIGAENPMPIMREIWAAEAVPSARIAVMERASKPSVSVLGRLGDRPAGCGFVACSKRGAMLHALAVSKPYRAQGVARNICLKTMYWAKEHGAEYFAVVSVSENAPARELFSSLGMEPCASYHYRQK